MANRIMQICLISSEPTGPFDFDFEGESEVSRFEDFESIKFELNSGYRPDLIIICVNSTDALRLNELVEFGDRIEETPISLFLKVSGSDEGNSYWAFRRASINEAVSTSKTSTAKLYKTAFNLLEELNKLYRIQIESFNLVNQNAFLDQDEIPDVVDFAQKESQLIERYAETLHLIQTMETGDKLN